MKRIKNIQKYADKWVLLNKRGDEVVKASANFTEVYKVLKGKEDRRTIFKVPPANSVYSP